MNLQNKYNDNVTLLLNGSFPIHNSPLRHLENSDFIICCDGAANELDNFGKKPDLIIGDLDSLNNDIKSKHHDRVIQIEDQKTNDLQKALFWINDNLNIQKLFIIGSTGLREDHSIGNISFFLYNTYRFDIQILTDYGYFHVINKSSIFDTFKGQCISLFCIDDNQKITTTGLKYKLNNQSVNLYSATLNVAEEKEITINLKLNIPVLIYLNYKNEEN